MGALRSLNGREDQWVQVQETLFQLPERKKVVTNYSWVKNYQSCCWCFEFYLEIDDKVVQLLLQAQPKFLFHLLDYCQFEVLETSAIKYKRSMCQSSCSTFSNLCEFEALETFDTQYQSNQKILNIT